MENEQVQIKKPVSNVMRKAWFDFVRKTRAKMSRGKKEKASHREAMKHASEGWAVEKAKVARRLAREKKLAAKK